MASPLDARPRLVVDNSSRIAGLPAQKITGQSDVLLFGHLRNMRSPTPGHASFPLVYPLSVELLPRPPLQFRSNDGAPAQSVDEVSVNFHGWNILGNIFRKVKARITPTTFGRKIAENRRMAANGTKDFNYQCGRRLILMRTALGYPTRAKFVRAVFGDDDPAQFKRDEDNVRKWEVDGTLVPAEFVNIIKELFGVSHDYIYAGDSSAMRPELSVEVQRLERETPAVRAS